MKQNKQRNLIILVFFITVGLISFFYLENKPKDINVILITVDALRADHLSCYGYEVKTSPFIDELARQGVLFKQAICHATWAHAPVYSLMTSAYPSTHGAYFSEETLPDSCPTFIELLRQNKYDTILVSGHGSFPSNFDKIFDFFEDFYSLKAYRITERALFWIKVNQTKKFFLWLHYMDTHNGWVTKNGLIPNITKEEIIHGYDEAIKHIDSQLEILLKKLKELGLYKNTLIVFTADHGQEIHEHGIFFAHKDLWESAIRVPLIIFYPRLSVRNKTIEDQVQHIDIAPTICDILKIKKPKTFEGISLLPLINGRKINARFAFSEYKRRPGDWLYTKFSIRSPEYKLIYTLGPEGKMYELYNIKKDPQELHNLVESNKEQFEFLRLKSEEWMARPKPKIVPIEKHIDKETEKRLKSLGYIQ